MTFARLTYEFQFQPFQQFKPWGALDLNVASGHFSKELRRAPKNGQLPAPGGGQHYETAIELTYRLEFRTSAFFIQPDLQYIIQPGGTAHLNNALVFGAQVGINF
jgi:porin